MTIATRICTILCALLLAATGTATAQGAAHGDWRIESDVGDAAGELGVYEDGNYADLDAGAMREDLAATLDTDASASDLSDAESGTVWTWFEIRVSAVLDAVRDLVGLDAESRVDANAEIYASGDGVDVDANVGDLVFDESPAGELDGVTWQVAAQAKAAAGGALPS